MTEHLGVLPVLLPLAAGVLILVAGRGRPGAGRAIGLAASALQLAVAGALLASAQGGVHAYALGNWPLPYGIGLVVDRLAALMVFLTALLAFAAQWQARLDWDARGLHFHALLQFQVMGLSGAFLAGDLFNLFVFFEVLLAASYGLLLHGLGEARLRAGLHYVVINLAGSALFVLSVGLVYGVTGTLNLADIAARTAAAPAADAPLLRSAALLMLVAFATKAAVFPLHFWLPGAYAAASAPVAALFAIMTKVGVYAILRVHLLAFGPGAGAVADVAAPWLLGGGLLTMAFGVLGALAAGSLGTLAAYLTVTSVGTMLAAASLATPAAISATLFYLVQSTLALAGLFLFVELVAKQRGEAGDRLRPAPRLAQPALLGGLFLVAAMSALGLPPLAGFLGKLMILGAARDAAAMAWIWGVVLATGLLALVAVARAGTIVFWARAEGPASEARHGPAALAPSLLLAGAVVLLTLFAAPLKAYTDGAAAQLLDRDGYVRAVLGTATPDSTRPHGGAR